jgi:hypothetical protein
MAEITLTVTLPDVEAHAPAMIVASLGPEQFEHAYQHWLKHWKALCSRIDGRGNLSTKPTPRLANIRKPCSYPQPRGWLSCQTRPVPG